ncbi:hypothetical protein PMZ80_001260 [Knufia obscura]|uniref:Ima1 N-terminal domain-containing protein n=1 Tax=Knufia obscura TaxID=1635080 RepID=A0ABR0S2P7_9EURO|nr:hypothetical protein PMZ80_001260 [Knufia obscura]
MPVTLRKRLQCHYCGKRLNTARRERNKIHCDSCSADNFFDENNNIVDVPATEASRSANGSHLPEIESESDIFCKTCLTNQSFYVRALADYLPDDDDPKYQEFEDALPQFKKELDLRYPRCCAQCAPRVQAQIQNANYNARTDHVRRLMNRSHNRRPSPQIRLRSLLIAAAGIGHTSSLAVQLLWHALSSQTSPADVVLGLTPRQCLRQWPVPAECTNYAASLLPVSLIVGLLCIWWNPHWQHRLIGREGRLTGLRKYYLLQLAVLSIRFTAWAVVKDLPAIMQYSPAVHTVLFGSLAMLSAYSWFGVIRVDTTPLVDWHTVQQPLVDPNQFHPPVQQLEAPPPSQDRQRFQIEALGGQTQPAYQPWRPPTPPSSADSMDWTPTSHHFNLQPRLPKPKFDQPSPFYGSLPAAPQRGSLNPKRPAPPQQKQALGVPPGFFGLSKSRDEGPHNQSSEPAGGSFAPPRFFAHEREADTGLENIFDKMFSVNDPLEVPSRPQARSSDESPAQHIFRRTRSSPRQKASSGTQRTSSQPPLRLVLSCVIIVGLAVVASSLCSLQIMYGDVTVAPSTITPYTAVIPLIHLLEEYVYLGDLSRLRISTSAIETCIAVIAYLWVPSSGSMWVPMWNKMVIGFLCFLLLQEVYHFCQLQSTPISQAATAQMIQSMERAEQQPLLEEQELSATSHPSPQHQYSYPTSTYASPQAADVSQPQHSMPAQAQRRHPDSLFGDHNTLRNRDSNESINSVSSIQTTSTAAGWKTPKNENRTYDWRESEGSRSTPRRPATNINRGLGGLSLGNEFGTGASVTGPRTRQSTGNQFGRYR